MQQALTDSTDWVLCASCAKAAEKFLARDANLPSAALPQLSWLDEQFLQPSATSMLIGTVILCFPIGLVASVIGMVGCKHATAKRNAYYGLIGSGAMLIIVGVSAFLDWLN